MKTEQSALKSNLPIQKKANSKTEESKVAQKQIKNEIKDESLDKTKMATQEAVSAEGKEIAKKSAILKNIEFRIL